MLPITDEITVLSLLHPCTPCTLVEINEVKCIRQGAHKSNRISSSLCSHNIGLSLKYIYMNMSVKCYLCTYVVYHITCMLGDNKDIVNWIELNWIEQYWNAFSFARFNDMFCRNEIIFRVICCRCAPIGWPILSSAVQICVVISFSIKRDAWHRYSTYKAWHTKYVF